MVKKLTKEQLDALNDLAVKTAKQEGVQKVRRWTDVGDSRCLPKPLFSGKYDDHWYPDDEVPF